MNLNLKEKISVYTLKKKFKSARKPYGLEENKYILKKIPLEKQIKFNTIEQELNLFEKYLNEKEKYFNNITKKLKNSLTKSNKENISKEENEKYSNFKEIFYLDKKREFKKLNQKIILHQIRNKIDSKTINYKDEANKIILKSTGIKLPKQLCINKTKMNDTGYADIFSNEINMHEKNGLTGTYKTLLHEISHIISIIDFYKIIDEDDIEDKIFQETRAYLGGNGLTNFINDHLIKISIKALGNINTFDKIYTDKSIDYIHRKGLQYSDAMITHLQGDTILAFSYFQNKTEFGKIKKDLNYIIEKNINKEKKLRKRETKLNEEASKYEFKK